MKTDSHKAAANQNTKQKSMELQETLLVDQNFPLFSKRHKILTPCQATKTLTKSQDPSQIPLVEKETTVDLNPNPSTTNATVTSFGDLGLAEWAIQTCKELGMKTPTPVQAHCIPKILAGQDVLGLAQTGSGKTAAFALPILHRLAEDPYGVFALVVTPTRELAYQLAEQFRALGSGVHLRCAVVVGGMDMLTQVKTLMGRPHVVIATPGRVKVLLEENPDIPPVFSRTKVSKFCVNFLT